MGRGVNHAMTQSTPPTAPAGAIHLSTTLTRASDNRRVIVAMMTPRRMKCWLGEPPSIFQSERG
jgi:hypothetical protein